MSKKTRKNKQNITKISAHSEPTAKSGSKPADSPVKEVSQPAQTSKTNKSEQTQTSKTPKNSKKSQTSEKPLREVFILFRPFVALGRYLRDSWREIRQVRWPNRKATWKMTIAVLIYCAIFFAFIILLDTFFTFIFNLLLGINK